jgi:hypothetical protein
MPSPIKKNKITKSVSLTKAIAGVTQHVTTTIVLGSASTTPQALLAVFQAALQAQADLDAAHTALHAKAQAYADAIAKANVSLDLLRRYAEATFGPTSPTLEDFGFTPEKPAVKSAAVKAASASKGTATRKAKKAAVAALTVTSSAPSATPEPAAPAAPAAPATPAKS